LKKTRLFLKIEKWRFFQKRELKFILFLKDLVLFCIRTWITSLYLCLLLFGLFFLFLGQLILIDCCELDQTQHGCRIDNGQCMCAFGCKAEFRYATRKECQDALKGRSSDICSGRAPCLNHGTCIQISQMPGYKCRCEGTGYWGSRCQRCKFQKTKKTMFI
jgi:hypothetical protein